MSILIDSVRISGFRGIKKLEVALPRIAVFIGPNNSGKTSVLKAIQIAIGDYRFINEEDFHVDTDDRRVETIQVDLRVIPVDENHKRSQEFNYEWVDVFGDNIQVDADENAFLAIRSKVTSDTQRGGVKNDRFIISSWPTFDQWPEVNLKETRLQRRLFKNILLLPIDAQRDLKQDIKDTTSFVGKILKRLDYDEDDKKDIEEKIENLNKKAAEKSTELETLQTHFEKLNKSFQGVGSADITPFPKKLRDLSKFFSVHVGETASNSFSMEYHGMGTRSWASLLTLKAFVELNADNFRKEGEPFFPILAIEEPEAHLHPNAQKTLYKQLSEINGQVIVSSHSPYVAAMAQQKDLRSFKRSSDKVHTFRLSTNLSSEDSRKLRREVIHSKGEILFAKAIILFEGETEEQALPILFEKYFEFEAFEVGVNFIGVGGRGKKYLPFFTFGRDFQIPLFVFSDGETKTIKELEKHYTDVYGEEIDIHNNEHITILNGTNFEGYLMQGGFQHIIEDLIKEMDGEQRIVKCIQNIENSTKTKKTSKKCPECKQHLLENVSQTYEENEIRRMALSVILKKDKTKYAPKIAEKIGELAKNDFPPKIIELFKNVEKEVDLC